MGMYSWKTADTGESIPNVHSGWPIKPVYLIQPNGEPPIEETAYQGYGVFGGVKAYEWMALRNLGDASLSSAMISLDLEPYYTDGEKFYVCGIYLSEAVFRQVVKTDKEVVVFPNFQQVFPNGKTADVCIFTGVWTRVPFEIAIPLKFSFDPTAKYEDLPASEDCPYQGCPPLPY